MTEKIFCLNKIEELRIMKCSLINMSSVYYTSGTVNHRSKRGDYNDFIPTIYILLGRVARSYTGEVIKAGKARGSKSFL